MTARPRLCFVLPSLNGGGAERTAVQVLNELDPARWDRAMYLFRKEGPYLSDLDPRVAMRSGTRDSRLGRLSELRDYIRETRPDVVVAFLSYFTVLLAARAARTRARVVFNQQTPVTPYLNDRDYLWGQSSHRRAFSAVAQIAYRLADRVLAASRGVADDLIANFGVAAGRVDVVNNPVDLGAVARAAAMPLDAAHEALWRSPVIVAAGRLADQKNYPLLIEAMAQLRQRMPARLFILGQGAREAALREQIARQGLSDAVFLCGFQANPWRYIARADVFALTSHYEGFGNVMVEAMACGVPVVATSSTVTREVVQDGVDGLLVEKAEPAAVAAALERVLCDAALRSRLAEGARISAQKFALPVIAAAYDRVLRGALA